ncbi:MAG: hypothetical protein ACTH0L_03005, partial [Halomonas sp.]
GFSSRMATADDNHVKAVGIIQETPRLVPLGTDDVSQCLCTLVQYAGKYKPPVGNRQVFPHPFNLNSLY